MSRTPDGYGKTSKDVRIDVPSRLRVRNAEIKEVITARIRHVAPHPSDEGDVRYQEGQVAAVAAVLDYALTGIERGEELTRLTPLRAVAQVHRAAQAGVGLDTVIRRYIAGYVEFEDFVMEEADRGGLLGFGAEVRAIQRLQASLFEDLIVTVNKEYAREVIRLGRSPERWNAERIRRLLIGKSVDLAKLEYEFGAWHLGMIGTGQGVALAIRSLAASLSCRLLCASYEKGSVWAWLGGTQQLVADGYQRLSSARWPTGVSLAVGQPAEGLDGWRLTHRQAQDALLVSLRQPRTLTLYSDVALLAPWLRDDARARGLVDMYLSPLDDHQCPGSTLRKTLRGYFAAGRNSSAAARALNISRRTMYNRMTLIEESLKSLLDTNQAELELALRLDELLSKDP